MSETEKSSGSVDSSESDESSSAPDSSEIDSSDTDSSDPLSSGTPSGPDSSGPSDDDSDDDESSSGGTGEECPSITQVEVTLYRIGTNVIDHSDPPESLCFDPGTESTLTGCRVIVSFVLAPFDAVCYNHLIARVSIAGVSATVAVYNVGGSYQVEWGDGSMPDLDLFPNAAYHVTVCLERTLGTPAECLVPDECCGTADWTSPGFCCCNEFEDGIQCGGLPCCCAYSYAPVGPHCECEYVGE